MPMHRIEIDQLKAGMKFSKSLFDKNLNIVLPAGKILDKIALNNLKVRNIEFVETAGEIQEQIDENLMPEISSPANMSNGNPPSVADRKTVLIDKESAKYIEFYKECIQTVSLIYNRYRNSQTIEGEKFSKLANRIVSQITAEKRAELFINLVNIAGKGDYLANHIVNTTILSCLLGLRIGYSMIKLLNLALSALVYDIGMVKIPPYIIEKEEKLSPEEFNQVKTHPVYSYQAITKDFGLSVDVARVGLEHHERYDGTGYPRRLKGSELSDMSKIVAIVDTYEALTKDRVYREGKDNYDAMKLVLGEGSKKLDPELLKAFLNMMSIYPVGCYVQLSTKVMAKVVASDPVSPFRPTVKIVRDEFGDMIEDGTVIKLSKEKEIYIIKAIQAKQLNENGNN